MAGKYELLQPPAVIAYIVVERNGIFLAVRSIVGKLLVVECLAECTVLYRGTAILRLIDASHLV